MSLCMYIYIYELYIRVFEFSFSYAMGNTLPTKFRIVFFCGSAALKPCGPTINPPHASLLKTLTTGSDGTDVRPRGTTTFHQKKGMVQNSESPNWSRKVFSIKKTMVLEPAAEL